VAIVDDADDLNDEAANAFLKTLEEPPPGAVLILIGTSAELQLETIISRCQVVRFDPLSERDLSSVLVDRGVATDETEAHRLASLGEGSVSRALEFADGRFEDFRRGLIDELSASHGFSASDIASKIQSYIKQDTKDSNDQRRRAGLIVGEIARFLRGTLWQTAGLEPPSSDPDDQRAVAGLAARVEPEDVYNAIERCLIADHQIQRNLYMPLILESFMHDIAKQINPRGLTR
jgi:DNA polymerase-3 subunit delta'